MDQELLDSSRYRISSVSVDSRFADTLHDGTSDFTIRMPSTLKNIMRIMLSSVELPLVEYLFSERHGNITIGVRFGGSMGPFTAVHIQPGNYTAEELRQVVEAALQAVDADFAVSLDTITGKLTITNSTKAFTLALVSDKEAIASRRTHWGIGYYMGFRSKQVSSTLVAGVNQVEGTSVVLIQDTPYYLLQLMCPDMLENITHRVTGNSWIPAFAKLILREGVYTLQFDDGANLMRKEYTFLSPVNITALRIRLVDPFGCVVDMGDMDWSLTFEIYEVVNSRTYSALGETYQRRH